MKKLYLYGMTARVASPEAQPPGFVETLTEMKYSCYYDVLCYEKPLKGSEIDQYRLVYIGCMEIKS